LPHQVANDRPDLIARVFRLKSKAFFEDIYDNEIFGTVIGRTHVIEFQKRGLPHVHALIVLHDKDKPKTLKEVDDIVCAEIPKKTENPQLWNTVSRTMLHGPCEKLDPSKPCMSDNKYTKGFPKPFYCNTIKNSSGYPVYSRKNNNDTFQRENQKFVFDNRWVISLC
jgi:hypothetical protein